jgi:hypothetical protein
MEGLAEIITDFFNSIGQTRKGSQRANVVRFAPESRHCVNSRAMRPGEVQLDLFGDCLA